jgi:hypothetical protein
MTDAQTHCGTPVCEADSGLNATNHLRVALKQPFKRHGVLTVHDCLKEWARPVNNESSKHARKVGLK